MQILKMVNLRGKNVVFQCNSLTVKKVATLSYTVRDSIIVGISLTCCLYYLLLYHTLCPDPSSQMIVAE